MALAARCPHCHALFRVVADQLKLRGGLVRCGECRHVFDAIGSLSYVDEHALAQERAEAPIGGAAHPGPAVAAAPAARGPAPPERAAPAAKPEPPRPVRASETGRRARPAADVMRDELAVPTLLGIADPEPTPASTESAGPRTEPRIEPRLGAPTAPGGDGAAAARSRGAMDAQLARAGYRQLAESLQADEVEAEPAEAAEASQGEDAEAGAPAFLSTGDQERAQRRRIAFAIACVPLALLAAFQLFLAMRDWALESWPSLRPFMVQSCSLYGCAVRWPAHAQLLAIVGSDLAAIPGTDVVELNAAIRSRAGFVMALPALEVTLTDTQNHTIARKVFLPVDYLASSGEPSSRIDEGLAPGSDLSVRLVFEARGLNATGFVIYPFYL
jgi:predicted Zn finger-like uncharacterized protein